MVYSTRQKFVDHENSVASMVTSAERTKRYRERLRCNQKKKDELKEMDRLRHKEARERERLKARADKRALMEIREKKRNEMRKYRAKKKAHKKNDCEQTLAGKKRVKNK